MPKSLEEIVNMERGVKKAGGQKIKFGPIVTKIIKSKQLWTVQEVFEKLVKKRVTRFRTKKLLDTATKRMDFDRYYDGKRFWYGISVPEVKK